MIIKAAKTAGFCRGVSRAVNMCREAASKCGNCVTLGPIIHNRHVTDELNQKGVGIVSDISEITDANTVIIRSHGALRQEIEKLRALGANIIDATCPDVRKIHDIVQNESHAGRLIIVIGEREHPEISAICSRCDMYAVMESADDFEAWLDTDDNADIPVCIVFQTTSTWSVYDKIASIAKNRCTNHIIYDTVCNATYCRQAEAAAISQDSDKMIVIGDPDSSNTRKLYQICREHCGNVIFIQNAHELNLAMFDDSDTIGVTAGASTPSPIIKEVIAKMNNETVETREETMDGTTAEPETAADTEVSEAMPVPETQETVAPAAEPAVEAAAEPAVEAAAEPAAEPAVEADAEPAAEPAVEAEAQTAAETVPGPEAQPEPGEAKAETPAENGMESFEEMLEKSIKTFSTGDKVTGTVTTITATEISLDLGAKQSGYIPISEFTDEANTDINDILKVGDTIEAFIMRVNDVEGMIMLSKKRLDAAKNWDVVAAFRDSREIVQGTVIQENRGGVVVNVKGVHVFVPASQTGLSKNEPMSDLLRKSVKLRINEVNQSRRRVIGSIRDAQRDERRELSEKVWENIEVGKKYDGVVKSMTSYGVFVDIGGIDGMIHISELSWKRIKQPSEVLSVGDEISVYILSFDRESRKISLGYKKSEDDPWTKFIGTHNAGDVVKVKIVKMMPFGAFAEICPGVDGLIHISQIAQHRIGIPSDVLSEGQLVDVKITEIDKERKKVSLSMRALIEPPEPPEPPEGGAAAEAAADIAAEPEVVATADESSVEIAEAYAEKEPDDMTEAEPADTAEK